MSNENPNNTSHWRNKLDELEHLPGSSFNSDAAWDKLHGRMRGNKKSKKVFWYWMAAACVLFGLVITLLNVHRTTSEPSNKDAAAKQEKKVDNPIVKVEEIDKSKNGDQNTTIMEKDKIVFASRKPTLKNRQIIPAEVTTKVQSNDLVINHLEEEPIAKPLQIVNNSTTAMTPPRKKLNVVHVNELGDPVIDISDMTSKIGKHTFKLGNEEVYANPSTVYKNTDFTILKTKL